MAEMVVFDYGRTLYDRETDGFFPDAVSTVRSLAARFRLGIVSVSRPEDESERLQALKDAGILQHFEEILFTASGSRKADTYRELLQKTGLGADEIVVVDDYIIRGIAWGNRAGAKTVWFRNGKFADLEPDANTGQPDYTIHSLSELIQLLNSH